MKRVLSIFLFLLCFIAGYAGTTVTYTFADIASDNSWSNGVAYTHLTISPITFDAIGGGNNGKYYVSDETWRFYKGGSLNITISNGYTITSITSNPAQTFTISSSSASISFSATVKFTSITITYDDSEILPVYKDTTTLANVCDTIDGRTAGTYILIKDTTITSSDTTIHYTKQIVEECVADDPTPTPSDGCEWKLTIIPSDLSSTYASNTGTLTHIAYSLDDPSLTDTIEYECSNVMLYAKKLQFKKTVGYFDFSALAPDSIIINGNDGLTISNGIVKAGSTASYAASIIVYFKGECADKSPRIIPSSISTINAINGKVSDKKSGEVTLKYYEGTSTLSATSDNSKFTVTCEDLTYIVKYKANNSCLDTATITFTYDTLTASIQVYGSNTYLIEGLIETALDTQVTLKWTKSQSVSSYKVIFNGVEHTVTKGEYIESGLTANTSYSYSITPIVNDLECVETLSGSITTQSCMNYPSDISYSSETNSISLFWTLTDNCNVYLFGNSTCTDTVQHIDNVNNTCTFSNLAENTKYYAIVYGGGTCPSKVIEVSTESPYITIVDWYPDSIHVDLNSADAATVMLEKEVEQKTGEVQYAKDLFFSKYFEAASDLKMIGIYNGTDHDISLQGLQIWGAKEDATKWSVIGDHNFVDLSKLKSTLSSGEEMILFSVGSNSDGWVPKYSAYNDSVYPDNWYLIGKWGSGARDANYHQSLNFSGAYSLVLVKVDTTAKDTTLLDVFGAGTILAPASGGVALSINCTMDDNRKAFSTTTGESQDGTTVALTTNSTILVRKNTVKDGSIAIANNTNTFKTLGNDYTGIKGEWWGESVCVETTSSADTTVQKRSCEYFSIVSTFDYDGYYLSYDSVSTTPLNTTHRNADGTYTIPIPDLDTLSCYNIKVISKDATGNELASHSSRVPIMVTVDMNVNNMLFTQFTIDTCKICDVVIRDNATLSTVSDPQRPKFRNIYVYSGSTLKVPANTQHAINSLTMRSEGDEVPYVILNDSLTSYISKVYFTKRITNDRYYFFSLPYDCRISDIYFASGEKPTYGVEWQILYYDGAQRASDNSSASSHWKAIERTATLKAGVGYAIATNAKQDGYKKEIVFPMTITNANIYATDTVTKSVSITAYGAVNGAYPEFSKDGLHANSVGWNFIGNPYLNTFGQLTAADATVGKVILSSDSTWYATFDDETNLYYTVPNAGQDQTYYQDFAKLYNLKPFQAMFIQAACNGTITFAQSSVSRKSPRKSQSNNTQDIVRIQLSNGVHSDYTTILIDNDYTGEYEVGKDLLKSITYNTEAPQIYSINSTDKLAFNAVNDSIANSGMALGVYIYKGNTNTFSLSNEFDQSHLEHVYLTDHTSGITTDLLLNNYSFQFTSQLYTNTRFTLNIVRKASEDIATENNVINQEIDLSVLNRVYDVVGRYLGSTDKLETLPAGIYIISNGVSSKKIFIGK